MSSEYHNGGNTEANEKQGLAALLAQSSTGVAKTGVLYGLAVSQTATASGSVQVGQGAGVAQPSFTAGASLMTDPAPTLNVFTANPVGGLPRNDIVVFDSLTAAVSVLVGSANATPTDPTIPNTALPLARLRHAANATTIPTSKIDDLRVFTGLSGYQADSGWQSLGLASGIAVQAGESPSVRSIGNRVYFKGYIKSTTSFSASTVYSILALAFPLAASMRPTQAKYIQLAGSGADSAVRGIVNSDGTMQIGTGASVPAYVSLDAMTYLLD